MYKTKYNVPLACLKKSLIYKRLVLSQSEFLFVTEVQRKLDQDEILVT